MATCALCRRNLLTGERYRRWEPGSGSPRVVCSLCEPEARRAGWERAAVDAEREGAGAPMATVRLVA